MIEILSCFWYYVYSSTYSNAFGGYCQYWEMLTLVVIVLVLGYRVYGIG